jgi:GNAT superfamily N-acetyltransferase
MNPSTQIAALEELRSWRDLYRHEMNCQIVCDSLHARPGWTQEYWLLLGDIRVGYGSVVLGGPWEGNPTLFEFYVLPGYRSRVFALFETLLAASGVGKIHAQSNDVLLTAMLHTFAHDITSEAILYHDRVATSLAPNGALLRIASAADVARGGLAFEISPGEWLIESNGEIAAKGGVLFHYNRPYGDIYMEVAEPFRRRGLGSYLVQELKRVCYAQGSVPAARCNRDNIASRNTLQKAGFVPCGHRLNGSVRPGR